jgi:hypothetical protein
MSYRVLCDENVEPATIGELEAEGVTATHVNNQPGQESTDEEIVALENTGRVPRGRTEIEDFRDDETPAASRTT